MEHGSSAWTTAVKTHTNKLDKIHKFGLRTILGATKITPIAEMVRAAGAEQLENRRQAKLLIYAEKIKMMPDHSLYQSSRIPQKQIEKEKLEPPYKRREKRPRRHPYN